MSTIDTVFAALLGLAILAVAVSSGAKTSQAIQGALAAASGMVSKIVTVGH